MAKLSYKTKGNASPQGKERVYFACHSDDFGAYFDPICRDIFATQNCAIFYNSEPEKPWNEENMKLELGRMQLIVIPVTSRFLYKPNEAREVEFAYAIEKHIPVLPLMQESGLENEFNRICGDLQFLDKNAILKDPTALPYDQKLEKYLKSVLLGDELATKVREAFDAYIFLSYRKKDRKYAQELMKLIHQNDFCRDIAIWYDEFLAPGENFNNAIAEAMTKSDLFTFVVTPNLLEPDNYVMKVEYPEARKAGKPILPAEMAETDKDELGSKFENIPDPTDAHDAIALSVALSQGLIDKLHTIAIDENNSDPQHNFFIGLAYLSGIDVEIDYDKAVKLITFAAEHKLPEAMERLADMYKNGEGVTRNYETSAQWLDKLVEYWEERFEETGSEEDGDKLSHALFMAGNSWHDMKKLSCAHAIYERARIIAEKLQANFGGNLHRENLSAVYSRLGNICRMEGNFIEAKKWYMEDVKISKQLVKDTASVQASQDLAVGYTELGDICWSEGNLPEAKGWYEKSVVIYWLLAFDTGGVESWRGFSVNLHKLGRISESEGDLSEAKRLFTASTEIFERLADEVGTIESRRDMAVGYHSLGDICSYEGDFTEAKKYYEKNLEIIEQLVKEVGTIEAHNDLASSYFNLAMVLPIPDSITLLKKAEAILDRLVKQCLEVDRYSDRLRITKDCIARAESQQQ